MVRVALVIIVVLYGFKLLTRFVLPWLLGRAVAQVKRNHRQQQSRHAHHRSRKEGETVIDKKSKKTKNSSDGLGEYVEYEELD